MDAQAEAIIQFANISKSFKDFQAVSHMDLEIKKGEILGFVGPNGAGKTTSMKMLAGLLLPSAGEIRFRHDGGWTRLTPHTRNLLMERMGFLVESPTFYGHMTPRQLLTYFARLSGYPRERIASRVEGLVDQIGLSDWMDHPVKDFSKGMRQKLGIISAVVHDPDFVVLDEPQTGLDPKAQKEMRDFIRHMKEQGKTVFLSSHMLYEIAEIADRVAIIAHGKLVAVDSIENLEVAARYARVKVKVLEKRGREEADEIIARYTPLLAPLAGLAGPDAPARAGGAGLGVPPMTYNPDTREFEIAFNGSPQAQRDILKQLVDGGLDVIEFNVPKTSFLEQLYLSLVQEQGKRDAGAERGPKWRRKRRKRDDNDEKDKEEGA
ncbi:MAG: ABC transporter ATP-binding protein [Candidatus Lokiarchaeota archaeon]|nr:ABC transporter ATP-binding protein [Candidatus Lokiarchaeota archaeon]